MFSRPNKPFAKDKVITASDLNWLKREATKILIGGPGMAVTRIGGRTVISMVPSQIVPKYVPSRGHIYALNHNLRYRWAWDGGSDLPSNINFKTCLRLSANSTYVYGLLPTGSHGDFEIVAPNIVTLTIDGARVGVTAVSGNTSQFATHDDFVDCIVANRAYTTIGDAIKDVSRLGVWTADVSTVNVTSPFTRFWRICRGCVYGEDSTSTGMSMWSLVHSEATPFQTRLCEYSIDGVIISDNVMSSGATGPYWRPQRLAKDGSNIYMAGYYSDTITPGPPSQLKGLSCISNSGALQWNFYLGIVHPVNTTGEPGQDVCYTPIGNVYGVGYRTNDWTGAGGQYAALWKLSSAGSLIDAWDSGGDLYSCCADADGYIYVCGGRTNTWPGASGEYATVWKLDGNLNVIGSYDTGRFQDASETGVAYGITETAQGIYVGCQWDGISTI